MGRGVCQKGTATTKVTQGTIVEPRWACLAKAGVLAELSLPQEAFIIQGRKEGSEISWLLSPHRPSPTPPTCQAKLSQLLWEPRNHILGAGGRQWGVVSPHISGQRRGSGAIGLRANRTDCWEASLEKNQSSQHCPCPYGSICGLELSGSCVLHPSIHASFALPGTCPSSPMTLPA